MLFRKIFVTVFIAMMIVRPAWADTDIEKAQLARIRQALDSLSPLISAAEHEQEKMMRVQFQYDWLRADIEKIKQGIEEKLKQVPIEPRRVVPIKGDYITYRNKLI